MSASSLYKFNNLYTATATLHRPKWSMSPNIFLISSLKRRYLDSWCAKRSWFGCLWLAKAVIIISGVLYNVLYLVKVDYCVDNHQYLVLHCSLTADSKYPRFTYHYFPHNPLLPNEKSNKVSHSFWDKPRNRICPRECFLKESDILSISFSMEIFTQYFILCFEYSLGIL